MERHLRGHHQDAPPGVALHRRLEGRLGADDREVRIRLPQERRGSRGGGVAGDNDGLDAPVQEPRRRVGAQGLHLLERAVAVGRVAGIAVVEEVLPGHPVAQRPQHADAAQARIKNADGVRAGHGVHLFLSKSSSLRRRVICRQTRRSAGLSSPAKPRCQRPVSPPHYNAAGRREQENFTMALQNSGWIVAGNVL